MKKTWNRIVTWFTTGQPTPQHRPNRAGAVLFGDAATPGTLMWRIAMERTLDNIANERGMREHGLVLAA